MLQFSPALFVKRLAFAAEMVVMIASILMLYGMAAFALVLLVSAVNVGLGGGLGSEFAAFPTSIVYDLGVTQSLMLGVVCLGALIPINILWDMAEDFVSGLNPE